jgi:hypothetical protein
MNSAGIFWTQPASTVAILQLRRVHPIKMKHRITEPNQETKTGICSICGPVKIKLNGPKNGPNNNWRCWPHYMKSKKHKQFPWRIHKKDKCEKCDFVPEHSSQLDVDHIDGNKKNNDSSNLQTLCANCHRLKTYLNRDWENGTL